MPDSPEPAEPIPAPSARALTVQPTRKTPRQATSAVAVVAPEPEDDDPLLGFAPYLHPCPRGNSITPELQRRFVAKLAATGIVNQAARSIGKSMEALYKLRARPGAEGFAAAWDAAVERGLTRLEDCALERALQGTAVPIVHGGEITGWYGKPDNGMLRFLLRHRLPQKYGGDGLGGGGSGRAIQPGHPVWEAVKAAVLEDPATRKTETRLREAVEAANLKARRAELDAIAAWGTAGRLEDEAEELAREIERLRAQIAHLERLLELDAPRRAKPKREPARRPRKE